MKRTALLSPCGQYRLALTRDWAAGPRALFIGVNPSTADADAEDATTRKMTGFCRAWGFGGYSLVNLYAFRSTDVRGLAEHYGQVTWDQERREVKAIRDAFGRADLIVPCWGDIGKIPRELRRRAAFVADLLDELPAHRRIECLGFTNGGSPRHPLMLAYATPLEPWRR